MRFDDVAKNMGKRRGKIQEEYDLLLINGDSVLRQSLLALTQLKQDKNLPIKQCVSNEGLCSGGSDGLENLAWSEMKSSLHFIQALLPVLVVSWLMHLTLQLSRK